MSDAPQGPGWWLATDGKFYPPAPQLPPPHTGPASSPPPDAPKRRSTKLLIAAGVVVLVLLGAGAAYLAGRTSGQDPAQGAETVTSTSAPASTAEATLSTAEVARTVAADSPKVREQIAALKQGCVSVWLLSPMDQFTCQLQMETLGLVAATLEIHLRGEFLDPEAATYRGEPPAELADLVIKTHEAAAAVTEDVEQATAQCEAGSECFGIVLSMSSDELISALDAWKPYGG